MEKHPLENMHIREILRIIYIKDYNIFDYLGQEEVNQYKKLIISSVMSTDAALHKEVMKDFADCELVPGDVDKILSFLVHASDIGNGALRFDVYIEWALFVVQEFDNQFQL